MGRIGWRKAKVLNNISEQSSEQNSSKKKKKKRKKKKKEGVLPELCVVTSPLGPTTASPSGSVSSTSPTSSHSFAFLADISSCWGKAKIMANILKWQNTDIYTGWSLCASSEDGKNSSQGLGWHHKDACTLLQFSKKGVKNFTRLKRGFMKGQTIQTTPRCYQEVQCTEQYPEIEIDVSISQLFTVFFSIFLKLCAWKKWHTFSGFGPTSLSYSANTAS